MRRMGTKVGWVGWACAGAVAALASAASAWGQGATEAPPAPSSAEPTAEVSGAPFTVQSVDLPRRALGVVAANGERTSISVPLQVSGIENLRKGDRIEVDYTRSVALQVLPSSADRPGYSHFELEEHSSRDLVPVRFGHQVTEIAQVVGVDRTRDTMEIIGPTGVREQVWVPAQSLQTLKPSTMVKITYIEAVASAIRRVPG
jgi:hypothetical protein